MENRNIGIATISTGFNYGSCLQAFALKYTLEKCGYLPEIYRMKGSRIPDRDARPGKIFIMRMRAFFHQNKTRINPSGTLTRTEETKALFHDFYLHVLKVEEVSWKELKRRGRLSSYPGFLCGSDQIWNASALYVDPMFYLRFAPEYKRIAIAPSFGASEIPSYNRRIMSSWIRKIPHLSVREESGQKLIRKMTGREAEVLLDPVFLMRREEWINAFSLQPHPGNYCLAYFLNEPGETAEHVMHSFEEKGYEFIRLPYASYEGKAGIIDAGPLEFLRLVYGAEAVLTDSFHALAFSILFHKQVFVFRKPNDHDNSHPVRLMNLLNIFGMEACFERKNAEEIPIDWEKADRIAERERSRILEYLSRSLKKTEEMTEAHSAS